MEVLSALELFILVGESLIVLLLPLELWWLWRLRRLDRTRIKEMLASASVYVPVILGGGLVLGLAWLMFEGVHAWAPVPLQTTWWTAGLCLLLVDFLYYWDHRMGHEVRLFWALGHSVHHSSPVYDQTTALRVSLLDGPFSLWIYFPALLIGFEPLLVLAALGVVLAYQTWLHTETIGRLALLDSWLNTPSNHRVHHGSQPQYLDRNYGAILMLWDRLFGTYQREVEPVRYGLTSPLDSVHPVTVHIHELRRLWNELRSLSWRERWRTLWQKPGAEAAQASWR